MAETQPESNSENITEKRRKGKCRSVTLSHHARHELQRSAHYNLILADTTMKKNKTAYRIIGFFAVIAMVFGIYAMKAQAATLSASLHVGSRGADVTTLQTFLAQNSNIYPQGTITCYFGSLTKAAVIQYQLEANLTADGVVGPNTRASMNAYLAQGLSPDFTAPTLTNITVQTTTNGATIAWNTSENATGKIYYNTSPLTAYDDSSLPNWFYMSGNVVSDTGGSTSHTVTATNLASHTSYYYLVVSIDNFGNATVTNDGTFTTM